MKGVNKREEESNNDFIAGYILIIVFLINTDKIKRVLIRGSFIVKYIAGLFPELRE